MYENGRHLSLRVSAPATRAPSPSSSSSAASSSTLATATSTGGGASSSTQPPPLPPPTSKPVPPLPQPSSSSSTAASARARNPALPPLSHLVILNTPPTPSMENEPVSIGGGTGPTSSAAAAAGCAVASAANTTANGAADGAAPCQKYHKNLVASLVSSQFESLSNQFLLCATRGCSFHFSNSFAPAPFCSKFQFSSKFAATTATDFYQVYGI